MNRRFLVVPLLLAGLPAQELRLRDGQLEERPAGAGLAAVWKEILSSGARPFWIGYAADGTAGNCWDNCCRDGRPIRLEPTGRIAVLYRIDRQRVEKIRAVPLDCEVDAGGLRVYWLAGVPSANSVAHLAAVPEVRGAVPALALHRDPAAVAALLQLARGHARPGVRGDALFWIAQKAGQKAAPAITEAIEQDPDTDVKKRAVFALSQLPKDESVRLLIQVARTNRNPAVRRQAFFWLGQSRDSRALDFLEEVLTR
jgi:hypothetical protein